MGERVSYCPNWGACEKERKHQGNHTIRAPVRQPALGKLRYVLNLIQCCGPRKVDDAQSEEGETGQHPFGFQEPERGKEAP